MPSLRFLPSSTTEDSTDIVFFWGCLIGMGFLMRSLFRTYVFGCHDQEHTTVIHIRTPHLTAAAAGEEILLKTPISHIKINMDITYRNRAPTPIELPAPAMAAAVATAEEAPKETAAAPEDETKKTV